MTVLAAGRYPSLHAGLRAERWRFSIGRVLFGALQMIAGNARVRGPCRRDHRGRDLAGLSVVGRISSRATPSRLAPAILAFGGRPFLAAGAF